MLRAKSPTYWEEAQVPHRNRYCLCDGSNNNKMSMCGVSL